MLIEKFVLQLLSATVFMECSTAIDDIYHTLSVLTLEPDLNLPEDSLFGFSIAYLKDIKPRLIVGAPRADNIGRVYECSLEEKNSSCLPVKIPTDEIFGLSTKHGVWLGASITAGSSFYIVCAPRCFDIYKSKGHWKGRNGTFGLCFKGARQQPLLPLRRMSAGDREVSSQPQKLFESSVDELGWSSHVTRNDLLIVGGPPMGKGTVVVYFSPLDLTKSPSLLTKYYISKYNLGYSVTSGNFFSDNINDELLAISSTYGFDGTGKVLLMSKNTTVVSTIQGGSLNLGAMFGAALCTANLEGDGRAELVVGAPAHSADAHHADAGAVYVYRREGASMILLKKINGTNADDYFGYAMVNVGDVDKDGYDDVAISAPGAGSGAGAVFVYSSRALTGAAASSPLQRLTPAAGLRGFGRALAALGDYDDNGCKELAVGAADSNRVLVYRCFSTLAVQLQPQFPNLRALSLSATSFSFNSCVIATYPEKPIVISAAIQIKVEIIHRAARLASEFNSNGAFQYIRLLNANSTAGRTYNDCVTLVVDTDVNGDFSEMLQYKISLKQIDNPRLKKDFKISRVLIPPQSVQDNLPAVRECKLNVCQPRLHQELYSTIPETYLLGSSKRASVVLKVWNTGDTSYGACVRVRVRGVPVWSPPAHCDANAHASGHYTCKFHTPLYKNSKWNMTIVFEMDRLLSDDEKIAVEASLHEKCSDLQTNHTERLEFKLVADAEGVTIEGSTRENVSLTKNQLQNKNDTRLTQTYEIRNAGVTRWTNLFFTFELQIRSYLEYESIKILTESLETIECEIPSNMKRTAKVQVKYVTCPVGDLKPKTTNLIYLQMRLVHKELESNLDARNLTFSYQLYLPMKKITRQLSVVTVIWLRDETLPWWLILLATILGLLLLILLIYVFNMMGFFGRKNKQKLDNLKREYHRRSMMVQLRRAPAAAQNAGDDDSVAALEPLKADDELNRVTNRAKK